jgi:hypothetical protein
LTNRHAKKRTSADGELLRNCRAMIFTRSPPIIAASISRSSMEAIQLGGAPPPETQASAGPITVRFRRNACYTLPLVATSVPGRPLAEPLPRVLRSSLGRQALRRRRRARAGGIAAEPGAEAPAVASSTWTPSSELSMPNELSSKVPEEGTPQGAVITL